MQYSIADAKQVRSDSADGEIKAEFLYFVTSESFSDLHHFLQAEMIADIYLLY